MAWSRFELTCRGEETPGAWVLRGAAIVLDINTFYVQKSTDLNNTRDFESAR